MRDDQFIQLGVIASTLFLTRTIVASPAKSMFLVPQIRYSTISLPPTSLRTFFFVGVDKYFVSPLWATQKRRGDRGQHEAFNA